jgi:hypothetical protein
MTETVHLNEALGAPSAWAMENLFKAIDNGRKGLRSRPASGLNGWLTDLFTPRVLVSRALVFSVSGAALIMVLQAAFITEMVLADRRGGGATFEIVVTILRNNVAERQRHYIKGQKYTLLSRYRSVAPVRPVGAPSTRGRLGSARRRQAVSARLLKPARAFMTAIGESCRRRGHDLSAVYDPKLIMPR